VNLLELHDAKIRNDFQFPVYGFWILRSVLFLNKCSLSIDPQLRIEDSKL
jgi:hypothetical protein